MARRNPLDRANRLRDDEELVVSADATSVRRGRRKAPRTEVCRPCLVWFSEAPDDKMEGVVMDLNPHGMRLRMLDRLEAGEVIMVQLMRDDAFQIPLSPPITLHVMRVEEGSDGLIDHGLKIQHAKIKAAPSTPASTRTPAVSRPSQATRMHTVDTLDARRTRRNRG